MTAQQLRPLTSRALVSRALICAAALLLSPALLAAGKNGYYRWTDDKGATQFSQQPPPGRASEFVRTATGTSSKVEPGEASSDTAPSPTGDQPAAAKKPAEGGLEGVPAKDQAKCEQTRGTQSILNSSARIREKGADGEYRYLSPDEIAEQKRLADEAINIYCE